VYKHLAKTLKLSKGPKAPGKKPQLASGRDIQDGWDVLRTFDNPDGSDEYDQETLPHFNRHALKPAKMVPASEVQGYIGADHGRQVNPKHANNPILVGVHNGNHYILDGNHRALHHLRSGSSHVAVVKIPLPNSYSLADVEDVAPMHTFVKPGGKLGKSNYGPKGAGQYTAADNVKRKQGNASEVQTAPGNVKVKTGSNASGWQGKQRLNAEVIQLKRKNKEQPVKHYTPEEIAAYKAKQTKLAASEPMGKGSMKRLAPFNPKTAPETSMVNQYRREWQDQEQQIARQALGQFGQKANPHARMRSLHKLSALTPTRRGPDGKRQFLLHRGMSHNEHAMASAHDGTSPRLNHDKHSSWTPHYNVAEEFGRSGKTTTQSAWVNEDHIQMVPNQYGDYTGDQEDSWSNEHEVIVAPGHNSVVVEPAQVGALTGRNMNNRRRTQEPQNIDQMINHRQYMKDLHFNPEVRDEYAKRFAARRQPNNVVQGDFQQKPKKLAASDPMGMVQNLAKAPMDKAHKWKKDPDAYFDGDRHYPIGNVYFRRPEHNTIYPDTVDAYSKKKVLPALGGRSAPGMKPEQVDMKYWRKVSDKHPHDPNHPIVFLDDGHHRATAAAASGTGWLRVTPSGVHNTTYLEGGSKTNPEHSRKKIAKADASRLDAYMKRKFGGNGTLQKSLAMPMAKDGEGTVKKLPSVQKPADNKVMDSSLGHHIIFSAENSPYPNKVRSNATHEQVLSHLRARGEDAHEVQGHYGSPERSIIIHNPKAPDKIKRMAHMLGQESVIHSDGTNHRLEYLHGEHAGKHVKGTGTVWHINKPGDLYTSLPDGRHFTHNLDFSTMEHTPISAPRKAGAK
jgi:hypothetical protein